jgi:hypothetical protein
MACSIGGRQKPAGYHEGSGRLSARPRAAGNPDYGILGK